MNSTSPHARDPGSTSLTPVPFRDTTLFLVEHNDEPYVAMRPVVESMGLD